MTLEELEQEAAGKETITILQAAKTLGCDAQWLRDWLRDEQNTPPFRIMKNDHKILVLKRPFMNYIRGVDMDMLCRMMQELLTASRVPSDAFKGKTYRISDGSQEVLS